MARPAARRGQGAAAPRPPALAAAAAVAVVVVRRRRGEEERHQQQQQQPGGTFEFNLPGHGNVKASWSVADDEESRWLDRLAADAESSSSSSSASAAGGGGGHRIPFGDDRYDRATLTPYVSPFPRVSWFGGFLTWIIMATTSEQRQVRQRRVRVHRRPAQARHRRRRGEIFDFIQERWISNFRGNERLHVTQITTRKKMKNYISLHKYSLKRKKKEKKNARLDLGFQKGVVWSVFNFEIDTDESLWFRNGFLFDSRFLCRVRSRRVTGRRLTRRGAGCWTASPRTRDTGQRPTATTSMSLHLLSDWKSF